MHFQERTQFQNESQIHPKIHNTYQSERKQNSHPKASLCKTHMKFRQTSKDIRNESHPTPSQMPPPPNLFKNGTKLLEHRSAMSDVLKILKFVHRVHQASVKRDNLIRIIRYLDEMKNEPMSNPRRPENNPKIPTSLCDFETRAM